MVRYIIVLLCACDVHVRTSTCARVQTPARARMSDLAPARSRGRGRRRGGRAPTPSLRSAAPQRRAARRFLLRCLRSEKGEVLLRGVGTLRYLFLPNASVQWQPDGLVIPRSRIPRSTPPISLMRCVRRDLGCSATCRCAKRLL